MYANPTGLAPPPHPHQPYYPFYQAAYYVIKKKLIIRPIGNQQINFC